jgi:C_GCAxxG_C_C family probable redox protein
VCQELEIETDSELILRASSGFAGGIGNTGTVCGAVVGGVKALGLEQGLANSMEELLGNLTLAREFRRRFEDEMGDIICRQLTGLDLSTEDGLKQLMGSDISQRICFPAVGTAYRLALDLIEEAP